MLLARCHKKAQQYLYCKFALKFESITKTENNLQLSNCRFLCQTTKK